MPQGTLLEYPLSHESNDSNNNINNVNEKIMNSFQIYAQHVGNNNDKNSNQSKGSSNISNNPLLKTMILEGDFEFLRYLSLDQLKLRMANLDFEMEAEIEELRRRYSAKRQPILDAMEAKKKRQQNF